MFNLGLFEMALFGMIALIVLGPDKLVLSARTLGKWYAKFLHAKERLQKDIINELNLLETQAQIQDELAKIRQSEAKLQAQLHALQGQIHKNSQEIVQLPTPTTTTAKDDTTPITVPPIKPHACPQPISQTHTPQNTLLTNANPTPLCGRFFLLGEYDAKRRLPPAPFLPNYQADRLAYLAKPAPTTPNPTTPNSIRIDHE